VWHVRNHRMMLWGFHGVHLTRIEMNHWGYRENIDLCEDLAHALPKDRQDCNRPNGNCGYPEIKVLETTTGSTTRGLLPHFLAPLHLHEIWKKATRDAAFPTFHLHYKYVD
jgi:hypothetical protein